MSNRLKILREKAADVFEKLTAITAKAAGESNRGLKEDEATEFAKLEREYTGLVEDIRGEKFIEDTKAGLATPIVDPAKRGEKIDTQQYHRSGRLFAFRGADAQKNAYRAGKWLLATVYGSEAAAQWCRENGIRIERAASEGVNTAGGFLVPEEFSQTIIDLREEYGTFRSYAKVVPMSRDVMNIPRRVSGLTAYWVAENALITESQKVWGSVNLVAKKLAAFSRFSTELEEDAIINIADDLANEIAYAFAQAEDAAGWNGDGTPTYGGILGIRTKIIDGTHTASAIDAASGHDTFAEIDASDLLKIMAPLPRYALRNAKWYASAVAFSLVFGRLTAAAGGNTIETLAGKIPFAYLGFPIVIDNTLPTAQTDISDTVMLLFGDLSLAVMMGTRRAVTIKKSEDRYIEYDQIAIVGTERVDINAHSLGDNTTAGPVMALVGE